MHIFAFKIQFPHILPTYNVGTTLCNSLWSLSKMHVPSTKKIMTSSRSSSYKEGERKQECLLKIEHANKNVNTTVGKERGRKNGQRRMSSRNFSIIPGFQGDPLPRRWFLFKNTQICTKNTNTNPRLQRETSVILLRIYCIIWNLRESTSEEGS